MPGMRCAGSVFGLPDTLLRGLRVTTPTPPTPVPDTPVHHDPATDSAGSDLAAEQRHLAASREALARMRRRMTE